MHQTSRGATGNVGTFTVTLASAVTAGHALVLSVVQPCTLVDAAPVLSPVVSVSGDAATWSRAVAAGCSTSGDAEIWVVLGVPAAPAGTLVTVILATPATVASADVTEYAGVTGWDATSGASTSAHGDSSAVSPGTSAPGAPDGYRVGRLRRRRRPGVADRSARPVRAALSGAPPFHGIAGYLVDGTTAGCTYTFVPTVLSVPTPGNWSAAAAAFTLAG